MTITLMDDGRGFEAENPVKPLAERVLGGNGLRNMRKRMSEVGGTVEIKSSLGQGTVLTLRVKL
jgi:signal transduction histidine kinase